MIPRNLLVSVTTALWYATTFEGVQALNNGVAQLPVLGYNTWNAYGCNINEDLVYTTAQLMQSLGLQDAGYSYVNIDDCWAEKNRSASGDLVPDPTKFPSGLNTLNDKIHALGFKTGIYGDSGWFTCGGYPGSWGNELRDANTFVEWGYDYLKTYDDDDELIIFPLGMTIAQFPTTISRVKALLESSTLTQFEEYERMANAIAEVAQSTRTLPMVYSLCEWGWRMNIVSSWGATIGQSWRVTGDISTQWDSLAAIINFGNGGLSYDEAKSHFTAWALMKSPLLLSAITDDVLGILTNKEIIAINQDDVYGESISPFRWGINLTGNQPDWTSNSSFPAQYWSGQSKYGTVVMLLNTLDEPATMTFNLTESPWIRAGREYSVRDLWTHTNNGTAVRNFTATDVPAHGVVALLLNDAGNEPDGLYPACSVWYQCTDQNGTAVGG
ncbi:hypothetical protein H0H92_006712 [Tricholoma furcatifolium]|nr:hypothetical protein H0H92_006712 [Tricholoma furcatifolium]